MKPIFCGNFDYEARQSDLERLFRKYGKVERVDMKSGFAFVYMEDERDAGDAIRGLDRFEFGRKGRRLRVEWTKQERGMRRPVNPPRRSSTNSRPSKTLFVINFDPYNTRNRDLERHFDPYGKILNVRIRKNFAFIQFESEEDASRALDATNMSKLMDRVISVEFAIKDDNDRRNGYSPDRARERSPGRRAQDRGRSPSPYRRERGSPDYGRGRSPSPYRRERASPDYGRGGPKTSLHKRERADSEYDHGRSRSPRIVRSSPDNHIREPSPRERSRERADLEYDHGRSHSPRRVRHSPDNHGREPSPRERTRERADSEYDHGRSRSPRRVRRSPDNHGREPSPRERTREKVDSEYDHGRSRSPQRVRHSPDNHGREPSPRERVASPDYDPGHSPSPKRERISPDDYQRGASPQREASLDDYRRSPSPDAKPELGNSPKFDEAEDSPMQERYRSRSPVEQERSRS